MSSTFGAVNGWWSATKRFSSSSYSNIGKSVTHSGFQVFSTRPRSRPSLMRSAPMKSVTVFQVPAPKKTMSPEAAPVSFSTCSSAASSRNFATGELMPSRPLAEVVDLQPGKALRAVLGGVFGQAVDVLAREVGGARHAKRGHAACRIVGRAGEHLELDVLHRRGDVHQFKRNAQVGLVRTETAHGLFVGHAREGRHRAPRGALRGTRGGSGSRRNPARRALPRRRTRGRAG